MGRVNILLVEDEPKIARAVADSLASDGYRVRMASDCETARELLRDWEPGLLLLDVMLPDGSGLDLLRQVRSVGRQYPVLILTANDAVEDRVRGLDLGADDYLVKPFAISELLARVRALGRRVTASLATQVRIADLTVDLKRRTAVRGGVELDLTPREFEVLELLAENLRAPVTREMISRVVWKDVPRATPLDNVIDVHIGRLRRKLDGPFERKLLKTVRGIGFVLTDTE